MKKSRFTDSQIMAALKRGPRIGAYGLNTFSLANTYVERFNRTVRYECLSQYDWSSMEEVQDFATQWMGSYHHDRPHMALAGFTPSSVWPWRHNLSTSLVGGNWGITFCIVFRKQDVFLENPAVKPSLVYWSKIKSSVKLLYKLPVSKKDC